MLDITVIILTRDEELHIERAIRSARQVSAEIIVVDSFSTDRTCEIAKSLGARVYQHEFVNQAKQFAWALQTGVKTEWVFKLDADEIIDPELAREIQKLTPELPQNVTGVEMKLQWIFMGRKLRFGGRYPIYLLRLFRLRSGRIEDKWMDEHIVLTEGVCIRCNGHVSDHNLRDISFFVSKHNRYATREAVEFLSNLNDGKAQRQSAPLNAQAAARRFLKERLYYKLPILWAPFFYFGYRMFIKRGFLDLKPGIAYHTLQGLWYRFIVAAKIIELKSAMNIKMSATERMNRIEKITGYRLE